MLCNKNPLKNTGIITGYTRFFENAFTHSHLSCIAAALH
ncbi:hypothetical protein BN130_3876 [Cronobacter malonaticus 507]|nr:hypothetical protein BN130_3876 [Cronobacter malonaticus 507]